MSATNGAATNLLLATLPARSRKQFEAGCERVELRVAQIMCHSGEPLRYVYFPLDCFISLLNAENEPQRLETGLIGAEGMLGVSLALGVPVARDVAVVQGSGTALRMGSVPFARHCRRSVALRTGLNRYVYVLLSQLARAVICTHYHVVEARLARSLLMTRDRAHANEFHMTHEVLALLLGVRRAGVTRAASALRRRKLIRYSRGHITILDEAGLEAASCPCYAADRKTYSAVLR
jgi:CRP-like cAMP-binding protein